MIIVNADDYGRSRVETDVVIRCFRAGRLTSTTAMMFMADSKRSAEIAVETGIDVGLHLNLSQPFADPTGARRLREHHDRVIRFLTLNKFSLLAYHPKMRESFQYVYRAQCDEFLRLYERPPSHIDGHQHKHLCTNMLLDRIIPAGQKVRRSFSFWPGEKNVVNRAYRFVVDRSLARRYRITDFFFSLQQCLRHDRLKRVFDLSQSAAVELMTHPAQAQEYEYLMSDAHGEALRQLAYGSYACL